MSSWHAFPDRIEMITEATGSGPSGEVRLCRWFLLDGEDRRLPDSKSRGWVVIFQNRDGSISWENQCRTHTEALGLLCKLAAGSTPVKAH